MDTTITRRDATQSAFLAALMLMFAGWTPKRAAAARSDAPLRFELTGIIETVEDYGGCLGALASIEFAADGSCAFFPYDRIDAPTPEDRWNTERVYRTGRTLPAEATARDFADALIAESVDWLERVEAKEAAARTA